MKSVTPSRRQSAPSAAPSSAESARVVRGPAVALHGRPRAVGGQLQERRARPASCRFQ